MVVFVLQLREPTLHICGHMQLFLLTYVVPVNDPVRHMEVILILPSWHS